MLPDLNLTLVTAGGTANLYTTNELPVDMHPSLLDSYAQLTPLTVILAKNAENSAFHYRNDWMEKKEMPTELIVATSEASAGATINVVANGVTAVEDTVLYNPRVDEARRVTATPTTNALAVTNDYGTAAAWLAGDVVFVQLPKLAENDTANTRASSVANQNFYNLQQLSKLQYSITHLADALKTEFGGPGSKRNELKAQKYREYRIKKEYLMYFGGRTSAGTAPATRRGMGGLNSTLRNGTLFKDFGGILTETGFRNMLGDYKDQNPDSTDVMVCTAGNVCDIVSDFGIDKVRLDPSSSEYGLDIMRFKSRGITAKLVPLPLLDRSSVTAGWGFVLDMSRIISKAIDRDTFYPWDRNKGAGGELAYDTFRGVYSLMVANETRHQMFVGALN